MPNERCKISHLDHSADKNFVNIIVLLKKCKVNISHSFLQELQAETRIQTFLTTVDTTGTTSFLYLIGIFGRSVAVLVQPTPNKLNVYLFFEIIIHKYDNWSI